MRPIACCVLRVPRAELHAPRTTQHAIRAMERCVTPEWLDDLPPADPLAVRSRKDLLRVNAWMGNGRIVTQALRATCREPKPRRLVDLGAGDGKLLLRVARRLSTDWGGTSAVLLDRRNVVSPATHHAFADLGWRTAAVEADARDWLLQPAASAWDTLVANLFLHHFPTAQLADLLRAAAGLARVFVAVEPRRSARSLFFSRLLGFIGCNRVTRHDAPVSVHAGFTGQELSQVWPSGPGWLLQERPAGPFSHLFIARRVD